MSALCRLGGYYESIPEVRDDLITTVGLLLVLFRGALGDLELVRIVDTVGAVGATTNLAAICAVTENLIRQSATGAHFEGIHIRSLQTPLQPRSGRFRTCILRRPCLLV